MKIRLLFLVILLPLFTIAQNPILAYTTPVKFYTQSQPTMMHLTINGKNMWPNYMTITLTTQIMHIHFKKNGRDEIIRGSGISTDKQIVDFNSALWLNTPGDIEIYITIDEFSGRPAFRSNSIFMKIEATPVAAPTIISISPATFKTGEPRDHYYIRIVGKNFGEQRTTGASIGGYTAAVGWEHLEDGVMDVWIPAEVFNKAGDYGVKVNTKYGISNQLNLKIEAPLVINKVKPGTKVAVPVNARASNAVTKTILQADKDVRLKAEVMKGVRVTVTGVVAEGSTKAILENFITGLDNVFVVEDKLTIADANGNINIVLKATGVDKAVTDKIRKQIQDKAAVMRLTVSVTP
ncbi:MAG: hypothetical protein ABI480_00210 [Chitinophagaceae bacterium]